MISERAFELSLKTWYPVGHTLHDNPHHPLGKLLGEWGELLDDHMKSIYKPGYQPNFADELGDIWYYLRILCYQRDYRPVEFSLPKYGADKLIAFAIHEASNAFLSFLSHQHYSVFALDVSYTVLIELLDKQDMDLDQLTELNWQKLKPGSERGEEWMKAR